MSTFNKDQELFPNLNRDKNADMNKTQKSLIVHRKSSDDCKFRFKIEKCNNRLTNIS